MTAKTSRKVERPKKPRASARKTSGNKAAGRRLSTFDNYEASSGSALLLHSHTGAGKTVLVVKESPRPMLIIDLDFGMDSVIGAKRSELIHRWTPAPGDPWTWEVMDEFRNYVLDGDWEMPYKVIVVDNITVGQKPVIRSVQNERIERKAKGSSSNDDDDGGNISLDQVTKPDWGNVYRRYDRWITDIRSAKSRGVDVIFTAGTREWFDANAGYDKLMPNLEGAERDQIATHMDAVLFLENDDDGRRLHLAPSGAFITKVRVPIAQHDQIPDVIEKPTYKTMMAAVRRIEEDKTAKRKPTTKKARQNK